MKFTVSKNFVLVNKLLQEKTYSSAYCKGFTLIEVMVVIIVIGILASLAYSSLMDLVFSNRAKETAQVMRSFTERAIADAKQQNMDVEISLNGNEMVAELKDNGTTIKTMHEVLSDGFSYSNDADIADCVDGDTDDLKDFGAEGVPLKSEFKIGLSGIADNGYFVACGTKGYCGGAIKISSKNFFVACIKKGTAASWAEVL